LIKTKCGTFGGERGLLTFDRLMKAFIAQPYGLRGSQVDLLGLVFGVSPTGFPSVTNTGRPLLTLRTIRTTPMR
jgi:hypothetical protein